MVTSLLLLSLRWAKSLEHLRWHPEQHVAEAAPLRSTAFPICFCSAPGRQLPVFVLSPKSCGNLKTEFVTFIRHSYCQKCPATVEVAAPSLKTYCFACTRPSLLKKQAFHLHGSTHISTSRGAYFSRPKNARILLQSDVLLFCQFLMGSRFLSG